MTNEPAVMPTEIGDGPDGDNNINSDESNDCLNWDEFFGASVEIAPSLMSLFDDMALKNELKEQVKKKIGDTPSQIHHRKKRPGSQRKNCADDKKRPVSISSTSSSGSSVTFMPNGCLMESKKVPYLTSIESSDDDFSDDEEEEEIRRTSSRRSTLKNVQTTPCNSISAPKPSAGRPRYWDPNIPYIDRVAMEIAETEKTYVSDLLQIITGYMRPITSRQDNVVTEEQIKDLFGNIEEIHQFNSNFLKGLELCELDPVKVAQCFVDHNEGFSIYTNYCTNYPRTVSVLKEVMGKEESAAIFKDRQASLEHTLPLGSYLLKPVQRILKYHLLLQNLVKHYEKGKEGIDVIKTALSTMTGIASHINAMKRKHEHAVRVQFIQSWLYGWVGQDLTTYGELVAEGVFRICGAKALRHVFLFDKMLLIAKKKVDRTMSYKTHIMCSNLMLIEIVPGEPLSFHVIPFDNPKLMYTLQARSVEQKREWSYQLKQVILENYHKEIPSHARQLVMELGQSKEEDALLAEKSSSRKQHSAPEYLEKRKRERRKSETGLNKALRMKKNAKKQDIRSSKRQSSKLDKKISADSRDEARTTEANNDCGPGHKTDIDSSIEDNDHTKSDRRKSEPSYYSSRESLSLLRANNIQNKRESEDDYLSCSYLSEDNFGDYETLTFPRNKQTGHVVSSEDEDPSGDYITFDYAQKTLSRSSCASPSPADCYRYYSKLANYDNLAHVWTELGTVDVDRLDLDSEAECADRKASIRRVQSFNSSNTPEKESNLQHTYSMRYKKFGEDDDHPKFSFVPVKNSSFVHSRPPSGIDCSLSPTAPSVWLKKQNENLAENNNKCGSLPRGFSVNQIEDRLKEGRKSLENRPITIASDKPEKSDFLDDFERYINDTSGSAKKRSNRFPVNECEDQNSLSGWTECGDVTSASNELLNNDYKIYRNSISRLSFRNVLSNVGSKLSTGIKNTLGGSSKLSNGDQTRSCSNISLQSIDGPISPMSQSHHRLSTYSNSSLHDDGISSIYYKSSPSPRTSAKFVYNIAKAYGSMLKQRLRKAAEAASEAPAKLDVSYKPNKSEKHKKSVEAVYLQGGEMIGARIANQTEIDYGTLKAPKNNCLDASKSSLRPDSVLSESSNVTSSSQDSDKPKLVKTTSVDEDCENEDNVGDYDGFYEKSFEEIENLVDEDAFRDSAIYSDQEEFDNVNGLDAIMENGSVKKPSDTRPKNLTLKIPQFQQMVDVKKVKGNAILGRLETLQKNRTFQKDDVPICNISGIKSIHERRKELEQWQKISRQNQSNSMVDSIYVEDAADQCDSPKSNADNDGENVRLKGWVKHLVGKFQADT